VSPWYGSHIKQKHWLSEETLSTIKKKRRLYRRAKKTRRRKDLRKFRFISNTVESSQE